MRKDRVRAVYKVVIVGYCGCNMLLSGGAYADGWCQVLCATSADSESVTVDESESENQYDNRS